MKRIRTHGRDVVLLALTLIICPLGVSYQMNDEIVVPEVVVETPFSHGHLDQECRLKMSFIALQIEPLKQGELPSDISWLHLENPLPLVYLRSEDRKDFLLTCQATHHKREGAVPSPVFTKKHGYGLVEGSLELKAPFPDYESLALREFLGIPRFHGGHVVHFFSCQTPEKTSLYFFRSRGLPLQILPLTSGQVCLALPVNQVEHERGYEIEQGVNLGFGFRAVVLLRPTSWEMGHFGFL